MKEGFSRNPMAADGSQTVCVILEDAWGLRCAADEGPALVQGSTSLLTRTSLCDLPFIRRAFAASRWNVGDVTDEGPALVHVTDLALFF